MTGLNLVAVQESILVHVETSFPNYKIEEDFVLDDESVLKVSNKVKPFIVIKWHGLRVSPLGASFGGPRQDGYVSGMDMVVIAPTPKQCRLVMNMILDELIGWKVADLYPLTLDGAGDLFASSNNESKPHLYLSVNSFTFQVDSNAL